MWEYEARVCVGGREEAEMVMRTLQVDGEVRPERVRREFRIEGSEFVCHMQAENLRDLRTSVQSFFDMSILTVRTVAAFPICPH